MYCIQCGTELPATAMFCASCGRRRHQAQAARLQQASLGSPLPDQAPLFAGTVSTPAQRPALAQGEFPLFPVATHKFIALSICTFSIYELYWCYQNWKRLKSSSGESLSPFWRAFFAPLWNFSLFKRIHARVVSDGVRVAWSAGALASIYLVLSVMWRLHDPWWWISLGSLIPMIPVQQAAQRLNDRHAASVGEALNDNYSTANVATIVVGGLLFVLAIVGTFMPE